MESVFAIAFLGGIFALGYWIGAMRTNLKHLSANKPVAATKKPAPKKKVVA